MKFRLLIGKYSEGCVKTDSSNTITPKVYSADGRFAGNLIETNINLLKFNQPLAPKFQQLADDFPMPSSTKEAAPTAETEVAQAAREGFYGKQDDGLDGKTLAELRQIAEEEEVDLSSIRSKEQVMGRIREFRRSASV
ncbi:hypothetical protein M0R72_10415 [Candidatus Pacearchaeota archaeon]|nr:hypothetical protein [Candidatus Pacearchaeota archaeon]